MRAREGAWGLGREAVYEGGMIGWMDFGTGRLKVSRGIESVHEQLIMLMEVGGKERD